MAFASVEDGDWVFIAGAESIGTVQSSSFGHRAFCAECGTPLYMRVDHQPETVDFSIATLDHPAAVKPGFHIFWGSRLAWFPADELPTFKRFRPKTRGPAGREPPNGS